MPWDLKLGVEAANAASLFTTDGLLYIAAPLLAALGVGFALAWAQRKLAYKLLPRVVLAGMGMLLLYTMYVDTSMRMKHWLGLRVITWDQSLNYSDNGLFIGFWLNTEAMDVKQPEQYTVHKVEQITQMAARSGEPAKEASISPNIIFIMSEAFWDPQRLGAASFSRDPLEYFRELTGEYTSGELLVPVFGGGTVNTEFEALTSLSTQFIPAGSIAYANYVRAPLESLASILRAQGYEASAIHTYHNWFYRRNEVYKHLGFDRFISSEFFNDPALKRGFITDIELTERIVDEIERTSGPDFIYAVSMQNHGPYEVSPDEPDDIDVSGELSESSLNILKTYVNTLDDTDESLRLLLASLEQNEEPSIVVFFGDHLPMLGDDYSVYREAGYYKDDKSFEEYMRMYSVPFLIWHNIPGKPAKAELPVTSAFHLGPIVLNLANKQGNALTDFLQGMYDGGLPYLPRKDLHSQAEINEALLEEYQLLNYDRLFGEGFSYGDALPVNNSHYHLGSAPAVIEHASAWKGSNDSSAAEAALLTEAQEERTFLKLSGSRFVSGAQVTVNGKPAESTFLGEQELLLDITAWKNEPQLTIQMTLTDSMKRVIMSSDPYDYRNEAALAETE